MADKDIRGRSTDRQTEPHPSPSPETAGEHQPTGRKRRVDTSDSVHQSSPGAPPKRARHSPYEAVVDTSIEQEEASKDEVEESNPVRYWTKHFKWPEKYGDRNGNDMSYLLARPRSPGQLALDLDDLTSVAWSVTTPSDQKPREAKSTPYLDVRYTYLLSTKNSFMKESKLGITAEGQECCMNLLNAPQTVPTDSLFRDDLFDRTFRNLHGRNETRVIRDISPLIVPSAETLTTYGAEHLKILIESTNEGWNNAIPLTGTRPQPDFAVGFRREAFSEVQLAQLAPFIGDYVFNDESYFMGTYLMYFPFLTCEVGCTVGLGVAERMNAHSMTLAVRATVELFGLVGREMELHREILAFSFSHDDHFVTIYGHYAEIEGKEFKYYRHLIRAFSFTIMDGRDKWTAYKFTKNIYDVWMPSHFKRLCSVIDQIPAELDFSAPQLSQDIEA